MEKAKDRAKRNLTKRKNPDWDNLDRGYRYLTQDMKLPHDLAIALMGNVIEESLGNYKAVQKNGGGRGLIQWDGLPAPKTRYGQWGKVWASVAKPANVYDKATDTIKNYWAPWNGLKGEQVRLKFISAPLQLKARIYAESYLRPGKPRIKDRVLSTFLLDSIYNPKIKNISVRKEGGIIKALSGIKTGKPYYDNGLLTINATLPNIVISGDKLKYLSNKADNGILKSFFRMLLNNNSKSQSYKNAVIPFGLGLGHERDNIINISNTRAGERDRLGMLGAVKGKDGIYRFKNPNYVPAKDTDLQELKTDLGFGNKSDYEFLKWCAENANAFNSAIGKPTEGDAWTRHGVFGDSSIVEAPYRKEDYNFGGVGTRAKNLASDLGQYVYDEIDKHDLITGDIVDMYYKGSDYLNRAFQEGDNNRTNSHTGSILKTGPDKEHTYVVHSTGNGLKIQPIGELLGSGMFKKSYITGIRRPGTKKHPYLQRGGIIKALVGTKFGNFLNNYGSTIVGGILQLQLLNKLKSAFDSYLKNKYNPNNLVNTDDVILKTNLYLLTLKELNPDINYGEVDFLNAYLNIYNSELNKAKQQSLKLQELNEFMLNNSNLKIDAFSNILESGLGLVGKYLISSNNSNKSSNNISNYKLDSFWTNPTLNTKRATS